MARRTRPANSYVVSAFYRGYRLDRYLQAMIPRVSRAKLQAAIRSRVHVSWHTNPRPALTVVPGGEVRIFFPAVVEPPLGARPRVLHEDAEILVADKPAGLLVHPTHSCLENNLIHVLRGERPGIPLALAHRLDRDTSGIIVLIKSVDAGRALARQFERREVVKGYLAIVHGRVRPERGRIDAALGVSQRLQVVFKRSPDGRDARVAVTDFEVLTSSETLSFVALAPRTGRRHQLRAHLASIGHPIVGDKLYGLSDRDYLHYLRGKLREDARRALMAERQLLHAHRIRFAHPGTGAPVEFTAPLPADMSEFLAEHGLAAAAPLTER